ncbi:hypothetical protein llap_904 [Limosa lapponica baueri]|uniref:Uncharacterized protein n=1 Tax=Limosa lapponica baueri TaxID=1758121 RepID=A0A2I0US13_LIMLA|nr:hypothetical protein llap_904 [Limosa lapponica baueri]
MIEGLCLQDISIRSCCSCPHAKRDYARERVVAMDSYEEYSDLAQGKVRITPATLTELVLISISETGGILLYHPFQILYVPLQVSSTPEDLPMFLTPPQGNLQSCKSLLDHAWKKFEDLLKIGDNEHEQEDQLWRKRLVKAITMLLDSNQKRYCQATIRARNSLAKRKQSEPKP